MTNRQNGVALPVLNPKLDSYKVAELYQWEMCVQLTVCGASEKTPVTNIGNKIKHTILHLEGIHGKNTFTIYSKNEKCVQVETFPKTPNRVKTLLNYKVKEKQIKNILLLLHVMSAVPFHIFKNKMFTWLLQNQVFLTKTIFSSTKEMVQCLGCLTKINLFCIDCIGCQELVNKLMVGAAKEKVQQDINYEKYNTTTKLAKFDVQVRMF